MKEKNYIGYVDFDQGISQTFSNAFPVNIPEKNINLVLRGKYIKVHSLEGRTFVGRIDLGPFYMPEGISPSSTIVKTFTVKGDRFTSPPPYYATCVATIIGELENGTLKTTYTRPRPKSPVVLMGSKEISEMLRLKGDMVIGHLIGYRGVKIRLDPTSPNLLPRNVGIFGTVGSGKTNTAQVLIEEASSAGWAVFVLDVEGEYTFMDQPNSDPEMIAELKSVYGIEPEGIKDFRVFTPVGRTSTRFDAEEFGIPFSDINPYVLFEIMEATEPQQRYFTRVLREVTREIQGVEEISTIEGFALGGISESRGYTLEEVIEYMNRVTERGNLPRFMLSSYTAIITKLERLQAYGILDDPRNLPVEERIRGGAVTVIDLSDVEDSVRNIVIAWLLGRVFEYKLSNEKAPPTMIAIEEAHTFISREVREKMSATIDMLKTVTRRGRKRWLSLVFISQQPGHLPPEIFELCNTRIVHSLKSEYNIRALRETSGMVTALEWSSIPTLSVGEALLSSPVLAHPLIVKIRPAKSTKRTVQPFG